MLAMNSHLDNRASRGTDVTCVIPTHDRPDLLARAVASVVAQTVLPAQIVVVDDMSDDRVRSHVDGLRGGPVPVRYVDRSAGEFKTAGASRNTGAALAETALLAFLDDDDAWQPTFLESAIAELDRSGADLVVCWARLERDGKSIGGVPLMPSSVDRSRLRSTNPGITGSNFLIRRSAFEHVQGFDEKLPVFNDLDFFVRFIDAGHTHSVVRSPLVTQFSHEGVHLSTRSARRAQGIRRYLAKHRSKTTLRERRRIRREIYVTERYPGQRAHRRALYFALTWLSAEPADLVVAVARRLRAEPRAYG